MSSSTIQERIPRSKLLTLVWPLSLMITSASGKIQVHSDTRHLRWSWNSPAITEAMYGAWVSWPTSFSVARCLSQAQLASKCKRKYWLRTWALKEEGGPRLAKFASIFWGTCSAKILSKGMTSPMSSCTPGSTKISKMASEIKWRLKQRIASNKVSNSTRQDH